ncbi:MAG: hypothetical protein MUF23_06415 [Pirellula sp.]|nr:hypothetical protein [Pirellula sp.]
MAPSKSSHQRQVLGIGLTATTSIFAVGVVCSVGTFAWRELIAREQLQTILADTSATSPTGTSDRPGSLQSWLDSNTSKRDTEAWGRVLNEVSGPYLKSQLETLFIKPSDDPLDWEYRKPGEAAHSSNSLFAWSVYPDELSRFLETVRPLLERVHTLCNDDSLVYIPMEDRGDATPLNDHQSLGGVCHLVFLECADAVHRKDTARLIVALNSLKALQNKFWLPGVGPQYLSGVRSSVLASALHLALDAEMLDETQLRKWIERLRRGSDGGASDGPGRSASVDQVSAARLISELVLKGEKSSFLEGAEALPTRILSRARLGNDGWVNDFRFLDQDYHQSALVRMALTLMALQQNDAPKSLTDIPSSLLQARDWTNAQGVPLDYTFDAARGVGILKPKRLKVNYHPDTPLRDTYEIDFSNRLQQP